MQVCAETAAQGEEQAHYSFIPLILADTMDQTP